MKALITAAALLALAGPIATPAVAFDDGVIIRVDHKGKHKGKWKQRDAYREGYYDGRRDAEYYSPGATYGPPYGNAYGYHRRWSRGQVLPYEYRRYVVRDYYEYGWAPPPPGYAYYRTDTGDVLLAQIATGLILSVIGR